MYTIVKERSFLLTTSSQKKTKKTKHAYLTPPPLPYHNQYLESLTKVENLHETCQSLSYFIQYPYIISDSHNTLLDLHTFYIHVVYLNNIVIKRFLLFYLIYAIHHFHTLRAIHWLVKLYHTDWIFHSVD